MYVRFVAAAQNQIRGFGAGSRSESPELGSPLGSMVIPPFLMGISRRTHAANFSFLAGVIPPMRVLGRSLL